MTYGMEIMTLTKTLANPLRTTQRTVERTLFGVFLKAGIWIEAVREWTVLDIIGNIAELKWSWVEYVALQKNDKWTMNSIQLKSRDHKQNVEKPPKSWLNEIKASTS